MRGRRAPDCVRHAVSLALHVREPVSWSLAQQYEGSVNLEQGGLCVLQVNGHCQCSPTPECWEGSETYHPFCEPLERVLDSVLAAFGERAVVRRAHIDEAVQPRRALVQNVNEGVVRRAARDVLVGQVRPVLRTGVGATVSLDTPIVTVIFRRTRPTCMGTVILSSSSERRTKACESSSRWANGESTGIDASTGFGAELEACCRVESWKRPYAERARERACMEDVQGASAATWLCVDHTAD